VSTTKDNLKDTEMLQEISKAVDRTSREKMNGLIVCLLSHGEQGIVYGSNSIPVTVATLKSKMASRDLLGIPKILIIQACQGSILQRNVDILDEIESDAPRIKTDDSPYADMFTFWSTIQGFASFRHVKKVHFELEKFCALTSWNILGHLVHPRLSSKD
jgi:hypothetical protein